jgi:uncharacterized protein with ATP-grasp and redox domains
MLKATYLCARCLVDQAAHAVELAVEDSAERLSIMTGVLELMEKAFPRRIPAEIGTLIHRYVSARTGKDPYAELKVRSNEVALEAGRHLREKRLSLREAVLAAVAGNAIDFGVDGSRDVLLTLEEELNKGLTVDHFDRFSAAVERAGHILYLTDNCGEIVFDYLLVEVLAGAGKGVTVSPKEAPILNDATVADLVSLGFGRVSRIVAHVKNAIGLPWAEATKPFLEEWERADLVIAKGMGHFETLYGTDKPIVFLLKAKCVPVAKSLDVPVGAHVLTF